MAERSGRVLTELPGTRGRIARIELGPTRTIGDMTRTTGGVTAQDLREVELPRTPVGRRGYDEKSVNDFLQLVVRRLDGRGHLSAADVRAIRFRKSPVLRRGYEASSVDELLTRIAESIDALPSPQ